MRALRKLQFKANCKSPFVFTSERGSPFTTAGFARMVERAGVEAKLGLKAQPHAADAPVALPWPTKGHDTRALQAYLGHRTSSTRCDIPSCRRAGTRTSGGSGWIRS